MIVDYLMPISFDNKNEGPGHKKDMLNIKQYLDGSGFKGVFILLMVILFLIIKKVIRSH